MKSKASTLGAIVLLALSVAQFSYSQTATAPSGSGTSGDPYQIATLNNLYWVTQNSSSWGSYFVQTADIDASSDSSWNAGAGFSPIGSPATFFSGTYDGQGDTISGLFVSQGNGDNIGMFGMAHYATIKNLVLASVNIYGRKTVGAVVGYNYAATVDNCSSTGSVNGTSDYVGGLVGESDGGTVSNSHTGAKVTGSGGWVGGLIGDNANNNNVISRISNCYAIGNVSGVNSSVGGLAGQNDYGSKIEKSYSTGNVNGSGYVGGFVGFNYHSTASIDSSYATGRVSGNASVGGFAGGIDNGATITNCSSSGTVVCSGGPSGGFVGGVSNSSSLSNCYTTSIDSGADDAGGFAGSSQQYTTISQCYSTGSVVGGTYVGGLVGYQGSTYGGESTTNSYSTDDVVASGTFVGGLVGNNYLGGITKCYSTGSVSSGGSPVGGLVGYNNVSSSGSFWDTQTSGQASSGSGDNSETTVQMKTQSTFTSAGWDFANTWAIDSTANYGYPVLLWQSQIPAAVPTALTNAATNLGYSNASMNGTVNPNKGTTTVQFVYGTVSGNYPDTVTASQSPVSGWTGIMVSFDLTGLNASSTYYYRVIVSSSYGSNEGSEVSFRTTAPPSAPTAATDSISSITSSSAIAYGTVNPNGDTTTVRLIYGTISETYTDSVTAVQSPLTGYSPTRVSATLSGLITSQTYYLRVTTLNGIGYVRGGEIAFTTSAYVFTETTPSGSGTSGDPHLIANLSNLAWLQDVNNDTAWGDNYKQTENINASLSSTWNSATGLSPIGTNSVPFSGLYNGQEYVIDSLYIVRSGTDYQGLFGYTSSSAVIDSLGITNANVSGHDLVGALVGLNSAGASITKCYSTGKVHASFGDCGGLVGENDGTIALSFSKCTVTGGSNYSMGGLVGYTPSGSGTISNCYTTGEVSVSCGGAGGLVGNHSGGAIVNCYSVSKVSAPSAYGGLIGGNYTADPVTNSFFDTDSTSSSAAGTGESSSSLKTLSTFTNAGWDFVLETTNGTNDYWDMDTTNESINNGYPFLHWQNGGVTVLPVEMTSFVATSSRLSANLQWKTATEVNTSGWEIQRKAIANFGMPIADWVSAGFVKGAGTSTSPRQYSFVDCGLSAGTYSYRLKEIDNNGSVRYCKTVNIEVGNAPRVFTLSQNYPNPFNPTTTIEFTLEKDGHVSLKVYDILGREVATLLDENRKPGEYQQVVFDGSRYSSGVYFAVLQSGGKQLIKKMLMVK
jgi:hypothetical protein